MERAESPKDLFSCRIDDISSFRPHVLLHLQLGQENCNVTAVLHAMIRIQFGHPFDQAEPQDVFLFSKWLWAESAPNQVLDTR
jgi:hypothetical protein